MMGLLLAVDLGVKTGLALYNSDNQLLWYKSQNYGNKSRLRQDIHNLMNQHHDLSYLVIEGGGALCDLWMKEADKRRIPCLRIYAEEWRKKFFFRKEMTNGDVAKKNASELARKVIKLTGGKNPTSLVHDAAEAILIGLWGLHKVGWLKGFPEDLK